MSFRTGVFLLVLCAVFYLVSFAQMAMDFSASTKFWLWTLFFGLAKTTQYVGLAIIGVEGVRRIKGWWKRKKPIRR